MPVFLLYSIILILLVGLGISVFFLIRVWESHRLHHRCVRLCHRIADELSQEQQPELVMERIFQIVIEHTHSSLGMLSLVSEQDGALHVVRTHGISKVHADPGMPIDQIPGWKLLDNSIPDKPVIIEDKLEDALLTAAGVHLAARQNMLCIQNPWFTATGFQSWRAVWETPAHRSGRRGFLRRRRHPQCRNNRGLATAAGFRRGALRYRP